LPVFGSFRLFSRDAELSLISVISGARASRHWGSAMGSFSIWHWIIVGAVALLLFGGKGKISDIMGDVAKGIKSFKKGLNDDESGETPARVPEAPLRSIDHQLPAAEASKISETHKVG